MRIAPPHRGRRLLDRDAVRAEEIERGVARDGLGGDVVEEAGVATRSGRGVGETRREARTSGWPSAWMRSAARESAAISGLLAQSDSTWPFAEVT
jgi:hypothetical protein